MSPGPRGAAFLSQEIRGPSFVSFAPRRPVTTKLLKIPEVMDKLSISRSTLHELMKSGKVPVVRLGRAVRIPETVVAKLMEPTA